MTSSPLLSTLIPLVPLAAMAWPLHRIINQDPPALEAEEPEEIKAGDPVKATLNIRSAHPFTKFTITAGEDAGKTNWSFSPDETYKEIIVPLAESGELFLTASAIWPDDTPETAIFIELMPDGLETRSHTIWGAGEITEEITFQWDLSV